MTILRYFGYAAFFLASLLIGLYITFPWEMAKDRVLALASQHSGMEIGAKVLEPHWITGLKAEGLSVRLGDAEEPLEIERLTARLHVLKLLTGKTGLSVQLPVAKGAIDADVAWDPKSLAVKGEVAGIELALVPGLKEALGLPLGGVVTLEANLELGLDDPNRSEGTLQLKASGLELMAGGKISGFPVPELAIGDLAWSVPIQKGRAKLEKQQIRGENVEVMLDGEIGLGAPLSKSTLNLTVSFKPTDAFLKKEPILNALLANIASAKGSDGFYSYALTGSFKQPRFFPRRR